METLFGHLAELAAVEAGDAEGVDAVGVGPLDGFEDVLAVARAADGDEEVARLPEVLELLDEDAIVAGVVGPGEDVRGVVREAEDLEALPDFGGRTPAEIFAEVEALAPELPLPMMGTKWPSDSGRKWRRRVRPCPAS
ncbi:MAG: hypothetical protein U0793_18490 [Gemmataceae bacterium]